MRVNPVLVLIGALPRFFVHGRVVLAAPCFGIEERIAAAYVARVAVAAPATSRPQGPLRDASVIQFAPHVLPSLAAPSVCSVVKPCPIKSVYGIAARVRISVPATGIGWPRAAHVGIDGQESSHAGLMIAILGVVEASLNISKVAGTQRSTAKIVQRCVELVAVLEIAKPKPGCRWRCRKLKRRMRVFR